MGGWEVMEDYQRWLLVRRVRTNRQVHELMTEFWMNHLNVPVDADGVYTWRFDYDRVVRRHALGKFSDLLAAATTHPAMGMYLSNAVSTKNHPNENLGRELLELHTVGRGNYTEDDVKNSARILTGYRVDMWRTFDSYYSSDDHWTGPVQVMDFTHANAAADGRAVTAAYLNYLATHPQTAQRIARKLAVKFVRDDAPQSLVDRLAAVYLRNDTAIAPVLRALVRSPEFAAAQRRQGPRPRRGRRRHLPRPRRGAAPAAQPQHRSRGARDPVADRVRRRPSLQLAAPRRPAAHQRVLVLARPAHGLDGAPLGDERRLVAQGGHHLPAPGPVAAQARRPLRRPRRPPVGAAAREALHRQPAQGLLPGLPGPPRRGHHRPNHGLVRWNFHRLLSTMLDSPAHLTR